MALPMPNINNMDKRLFLNNLLVMACASRLVKLQWWLRQRSVCLCMPQQPRGFLIRQRGDAGQLH
jgi:hypothetical protein